MNGPTLGNPQNTIEILQKYQFSFQKKFGQNFLTDQKGVLRKIMEVSAVNENDTVLEIGPGEGALTALLLDTAEKVVTVEIDRDLE